MRISLRWRILLLTVLTPATLGLATLLTVSRNVSDHVNSSSIHESLEHSSLVFESMLRVRSRELAGSAHVIAQDPRFFSLLMLRSAQRDNRFAVTVRGMAQDFNRISQADLFEVFDREGRLLASVGRVASARPERDSLMRIARREGSIEAVMTRPDAHYQVALRSVVADGRIVGMLLLGAPIGTDLARQLRSMMRCEVTFVSGAVITGTTHDALADRKALTRAMGRLAPGPGRSTGPVTEIGTPSGTWLTLARRIPVSDPQHRQFYVLQRSFDPETSFLRVMRNDMMLLALLALVAALVTGLLFAEQILRPIQGLVRGAREMERGNYDHPVNVRGRDEIGYLAERFVEMRHRERAYLDSLEQATRLKSQFLSMASHELRTPISVLRGYRDIIASGDLGPVTPKQQDALGTMREHLARLTRLAEDAGRFARLKSERIVLDFGLHDLATVVRNAVAAACTVGADRDVHVETRVDPVADAIVADAESLEQAIFQIVTNAIRFTPDGGRVDVQARCDEDRLRIIVSDTGVGIPPERLDVLFVYGVSDREVNKHHTAEGLEFNAPGLGLGLSVARAIVEAHGGRIEVQSVVDQGSTFLIDMPLRELESEPAA